MTTERPDELFTAIAGEFQEIIGRVIIHDQKTSGTDGGTFTTGAWRTRDLNTTVLNTLGSGYSLLSNQFTLPAGVYLIATKSSALQVERHQSRLQNITDSITELSGTSEISKATDATQTSTHIVGSFVISIPKIFEIQHRCSATKASNGFGVNSGSTFTVKEEVYTVVHLWKIG